MAWITTNAFLSQSEMENNCLELCRNLIGTFGWTENAVAAMAGNMQTESSINPGIWENLDAYNYDNGFGLVQWTPATKYIQWAGANWLNGDRECERIKYEVDNGIQWFSNPEAYLIGYPYDPPMSFSQFVMSTDEPGYLGMCFLLYYEHPGEVRQWNRATQARDWYTFITGHDWHKKPPVGALAERKKNNGYIRRKRLFKY